MTFSESFFEALLDYVNKYIDTGAIVITSYEEVNQYGHPAVLIEYEAEDKRIKSGIYPNTFGNLIKEMLHE